MARQLEGGGHHGLSGLPDDVLCLSLKSLTLENQISIRRVCKRFQTISDLLLSGLKKISKEELQSLSFDGREWLLKECKLSNLRSVCLVSIELNEKLAEHLACYSPLLKTINFDGTCYNRGYEFVEQYLKTFEVYHPFRVPRLQVDNLVETDERLKCLLDKFPKWDVHLSSFLPSLSDWKGYFHHVNKIVISKNCDYYLQNLPENRAQFAKAFPNLEVIAFSDVTPEDCFEVRHVIETSKEVVFENLSIQNYAVILALEGVRLSSLTINLKRHKGTKTRMYFLQTLDDYLKCCGQSLKYIKVSTSHSGDSVKLIQMFIKYNMLNVEFETGNPSEKFTFKGRSLQLNYWNGSLEPLLNTFFKAREVKIVTDPNFDVFEWVSEIKSFASKKLNCFINVTLFVQSHPESVPVITVNGNNYKLSIPKVVGLNFNLNINNVLFAFNLAEKSQMTDLRNKSLCFMKNFLGNKLSKECSSSREICNLFQSSTQ